MHLRNHLTNVENHDINQSQSIRNDCRPF